MKKLVGVLWLYDFKTDKKSGIYKHIQECPTCKNADKSVGNFQILKSCRSPLESAIFEALFINKLKPVINRKLGYEGKVIRLNAF